MLIYGLTPDKSFTFANLTPQEEELVLTIGTWYLVHNSQMEWNEAEQAHQLNLEALYYLTGGEA